MSINKDFQFSHNWNNKLDNDVFTTLRLSDRWNVGDQGDIFLKHLRKGRGEVVIKVKTTFGAITDGVAYIDTGYDANTCRQILQTMYNGQVLTNAHVIYLYFIKRIKTPAEPQPDLFTHSE